MKQNGEIDRVQMTHIQDMMGLGIDREGERLGGAGKRLKRHL